MTATLTKLLVLGLASEPPAMLLLEYCELLQTYGTQNASLPSYSKKPAALAREVSASLFGVMHG